MKRTITTPFHQPNNNTDLPDEEADNDPAPRPAPPIMHVANATPHPMGLAGNPKATAIQILGPTSQPLLVSRGQTAVPQQAPGSTQERSIQDTDVNLADKDGRTPLMFAARDGDLPAVQALLSKGAHINATDNNGWTPLMCAARQGQLTTVQALLSAPGININVRTNTGATALHIAAFRGKDEIVKALIQKNADVNIANNNGQTPLMYAAEQGHLTTMQALSPESAAGITPLELLQKYRT